MQTFPWAAHRPCLGQAAHEGNIPQDVSSCSSSAVLRPGLRAFLAAVQVITHELPLTEAPHAYKIFNEKKEGCVKVVMHPWQ